jgi:hypothetical protein
MISTEGTDIEQTGTRKRIACLSHQLVSGECQGLSQSTGALPEGHRELVIKAFLQLTVLAAILTARDEL